MEQKTKIKRKKWTDKEVEKLERLAMKYTKSDIAKKMGRSVGSVNSKIHRTVEAGLINMTDKWTFAMITEAVGCSKGVINKTWTKYGLPYVKRGYYCLVDEKDFLNFMKEHPDLWNATKCDYSLFSRYDWFLKKYEEDKKIPVNQRNYFWSDYQKQQFFILKKRGFKHKEIAEKIGKSESAVEHFSARNKEKIEKWK